MNARVFSSLLRMATLATRFAFVFFLAKFLTPADVGLYGLFTATIAYSIYLVGLDFYVYSTRETINATPQQISLVIKNQFAVSAVLYAIVTPLLMALIIAKANWPIYMAILFTPILFIEHVNQELFRLFIAQSQQLVASVLLFIRQASWGLTAVFVIFLSPAARNLELILLLWLVAGVLAVVGGAIKLKQMGIRRASQPIEWTWIKKGIATSAAFLVATLALRAILTFDRYAIEAIGGMEMVGAYVLFSGMAASLLAFLDAGVFSFSYPLLLKYAKENKQLAFSKQMWHMLGLTIAACFAFCVVAHLLLPYLLSWLDKEIYLSSVNIFYWVLAATVLNAIGLIPHYGLYAIKKDRIIISSHIIALLIFIIGIVLLKPYSGTLAIPQSIAIAFLFILLWKSVFYALLQKEMPGRLIKLI